MGSNVFERARPKPVSKPAPKRPARTALRALVPSSYNAEGETDPFVKAYKSKWLSKLDFTSDVNVQSLFMLSILVLALGREQEAELIAVQLIKHVDAGRVNTEGRAAIVAALRLAAWLKSKRGVDAGALLARARELSRDAVDKDREWLSLEAAGEIQDALERKKLAYLAYPLNGILRWLNESAARAKAEALLGTALDAARALMR